MFMQVKRLYLSLREAPARQTRQKCVSLHEAQTRQRRQKKSGLRMMQASLSHLLLLATSGLAVRPSPGCGAEIPHQPHPGKSILKKPKHPKQYQKSGRIIPITSIWDYFGHHSCWEGFKSIHSHLLLRYCLSLTWILVQVGPITNK